MFTVTMPNDAWILHRLDFYTQQEGACNLYVLMDAHSGFCFGFESSQELPSDLKISKLIEVAKLKSSCLPKKIVIDKADPYVESLQAICHKFNLDLEEVPKKVLLPFVKSFIDSFQNFSSGGNESSLSEEEEAEMEAFIPATYGPCPCASGEKYKFCCQKAFKPIVFAMCEVQDGRLESALRYMKEAEEKVGRTAEVVCRLAICWSFSDKEKTQALFQEALSINPNHPRLNYLLGLDAAGEERYDQAVEFYQKAISKYPAEDKYHLNEAYNNLGTVFYRQKKYKEAKDAWEKALVFLPSDRMVKGNLFQLIYTNPILPEELREMSPFMEKFFMGRK